MSNWTHSICADCWNVRNPDRQAVHIADEYAEKETCCFCGNETTDGIYVRANPNEPEHCNHTEGDQLNDKQEIKRESQ